MNLKHDSEVLKDLLKAHPGEKEFGVRIPEKECTSLKLWYSRQDWRRIDV